MWAAVPAFLLLWLPCDLRAQELSVEIRGPERAVVAGEEVPLSARVLDQDGNPRDDVPVIWFALPFDVAAVDEEGVFRGFRRGEVTVLAIAGRSVGQARVRVLPKPPVRVDLQVEADELVVGGTTLVSAVPRTEDDEPRSDLRPRFRSLDPEVAGVDEGGAVTGLAPGSARIAAEAVGAAGEVTVRVVVNPVRSLRISGPREARTGDVVRFRAEATDDRGASLADVPVRWAVSGPGAAAYPDGGFVAEELGTHLVTATAGGVAATASIHVTPRTHDRRVVGVAHRGFGPIQAGELWVHGDVLYTSTLADRIYTWDVSDPSNPVKVDSAQVDARFVNDVTVSADGRTGIMTREGAADRRNGLVFLDLSDPLRPEVLTHYTEGLTGGVHTVYIDGHHAYATDNATGSLRIIDFQDPRNPREVARWAVGEVQDAIVVEGIGELGMGQYLHDTQIVDGLAYLAYWRHGLLILDVGHGIRGGSPESPRFVSQYVYSMADYYPEDRLAGTHTVFRYGDHVFVGDEVFPGGFDLFAPERIPTLGRVHVLDVRDLENPRKVAEYNVQDNGAHNIWVEDDVLYMGYYEGGLRVVDVSGELRGDLHRQGREIGHLWTGSPEGFRPNLPMAWGAKLHRDHILVTDINSGLWVARLESLEPTAVARPDLPDLVLAGGTVMDPGSGLEAVRHVAIRDGSIVAVTSEPVEARDTVDVSGLVVAPGFIDLHAHGQYREGRLLQARDGVTTALELETGVYPVGSWYEAQEREGSPIHYGASVSHPLTRLAVLDGIELGHLSTSSAAADVPLDRLAAVRQPADEAQLREIAGAMARGLEEGGLGFGFGINYTPAATPEEVEHLFGVAAERGAPVFVHTRDFGVESVEEVIGHAERTGAALHIVHIGSSTADRVEEALALIDAARARGVDATTEVYPYTAASTRLETPIFDPGWRERLGISYEDVVWVETGERLTEETFQPYRERGGWVVVHFIPEETVRRALAHPGVIVASDGVPFVDGRGHPRGAGTFSRVLGHYVREEGTLGLMEALEKMTWLPARRLEAVAPGMARKGRVQVGADADLTIFDPAGIRDRATFPEPTRPSEGIEHVLVDGTFVVREGEPVPDALPGRGIRSAPERAGHERAGHETAEPIRIGATMSKTGPLATQGVPAANGYRLCGHDVNARDGLLGRKVEFVILDDRSDPDTAIALYERLIVQDGVDAVMGPYGSTITEAVAPVTERHRKVMIAPLAATSSIWEQGRRYIFMVLPPAELFLAGLIEMASERGLESVAILQEDALFPRAAGAGAAELAEKKGMEVALHETYPTGTEDFSTLLARVDAGGADVLGMAASSLGDFVTVVRQMKEREVDVHMFGTSGAVAEFQEALGEDAEYAYGLSAWEPGLPNPGIEEFVDAYRREFDQAPSFHAAGAYGSCQIFMEAARRAGTLDADALREELLDLEIQTVFSDFAVDERGYQTANRGLFIQWKDGEKVVVWPEELATAEPWFPTPPWNRR